MQEFYITVFSAMERAGYGKPGSMIPHSGGGKRAIRRRAAEDSEDTQSIRISSARLRTKSLLVAAGNQSLGARKSY
jgi:hypothetical protein